MNLHLLPAVVFIFLCFIIEFLVESSHIDSIGKLFFLEYAPLDVAIAIHLLLKFIVHIILHLTFAIDYMLGYFLVLLWSKMRLSRLLNVFFVDLFTHLIHLDLFM